MIILYLGIIYKDILEYDKPSIIKFNTIWSSSNSRYFIFFLQNVNNIM